MGDLREALLSHYDRAARTLPWRGETDPYRVLVSEVMLQQTRVETVKRYYGRWLERFPDVAALAAAEEDEVLKAWEGLGYYRRARSLHAAARRVRERGAFPDDLESLSELPGVGAYTAGAVASIAFGRAAPAVDGNVRRVLARLHDVPDPTPAWLRRAAAALVDPERPGDWNQALMELGATICTPRAPTCDDCPVRAWCAARRAGTVPERPRARARKAVPRARLVLGVFHHGGRLLLVRRPPDGLLGGLWAFPELALDDPEERSRVDDGPISELASSLGLELAGPPAALDPVDHRFTHLHARYLPALTPVDARIGGPDRVWPDIGAAGALALGVAQRAVLDAACRALEPRGASPSRSAAPDPVAATDATGRGRPDEGGTATG